MEATSDMGDVQVALSLAREAYEKMKGLGKMPSMGYLVSAPSGLDKTNKSLKVPISSLTSVPDEAFYVGLLTARRPQQLSRLFHVEHLTRPLRWCLEKPHLKLLIYRHEYKEVCLTPSQESSSSKPALASSDTYVADGDDRMDEDDSDTIAHMVNSNPLHREDTDASFVSMVWHDVGLLATRFEGIDPEGRWEAQWISAGLGLALLYEWFRCVGLQTLAKVSTSVNSYCNLLKESLVGAQETARWSRIAFSIMSTPFQMTSLQDGPVMISDWDWFEYMVATGDDRATSTRWTTSSLGIQVPRFEYWSRFVPWSRHATSLLHPHPITDISPTTGSALLSSDVHRHVEEACLHLQTQVRVAHRLETASDLKAKANMTFPRHHTWEHVRDIEDMAQHLPPCMANMRRTAYSGGNHLMYKQRMLWSSACVSLGMDAPEDIVRLAEPVELDTHRALHALAKRDVQKVVKLPAGSNFGGGCKKMREMGDCPYAHNSECLRTANLPVSSSLRFPADFVHLSVIDSHHKLNK